MISVTKHLLKKVQKRASILDYKNPKRFKKLKSNPTPQQLQRLYPKTYKWLRVLLQMNTGTVPAKVLYLICNYKLGIPSCSVCGAMTNYNRELKTFYKFCSGQCAISTPECKEKRAATNTERYGGNAPICSAQIKARILKTNIERHGKNFYKKRAKKTVATSLQRYGVTNAAKAKVVRGKISEAAKNRTVIQKEQSLSKRRVTLIKKYGSLKKASQSAKVARVKTMLQRHGVEYSLQSESIRAKKEKTHLKRYGVKHPLQHPPSFEKQQKARYKRKPVKINGKVYEVHGFEHLALIAIRTKILKLAVRPAMMPNIRYLNAQGSESRYFPDAKILTKKGTKIILEVKSAYTLKAALKQNLRKFKAANAWCANHDYTFVLAVVTKLAGKVTVRWISNPTKTKIQAYLTGE